ncbi:MAG TPA: acyl-CoA dehydrogenase domain-containing protein, partial [Methylotenera sp.]|nr:acyl-CoA dehydrogenase domain-containing protein [Methylotenera sp.]
TVEGANILTRNMIIFGQGALRCHPYLLKEVNAAHDKNPDSASMAFDEALIGHAKFTLRNTANSLVYALFGNHIKDNAPENATPETATYYRQLARFSASFACIADIGLMRLGGSLKRKERLSARLGDILSMLYLCSATLKRFEDDGRPDSDLPLLHWCMQDAIYRMQQAFDEFLANIPGHFTFVGLLRILVFPLGKRCKPPVDALTHEVARLMMVPGVVRDRLTAGIHVPTAEHEPMADLEQALRCVIECGAIEAKLREAVKLRKITDHGDGQIAQALQLNVITAEEASLLEKLKDLRSKVIKVDDFRPDLESEAPGRHNAVTGNSNTAMSARGAINANYTISNDVTDEADGANIVSAGNSTKSTSRKKSNPVTEESKAIETIK